MMVPAAPSTSVGIRNVPILGQATLVCSWDSRSATAYLQNIQDRLREPRMFWGGVGRVMRASMRRNFAEGGRPKWTPLKAGTVSQKAQFLKGKPTPPFSKSGKPLRRLLQQGTLGPKSILIRTGKLRDSWARQGAEGHLEEASATGEAFFFGSQLMLQRDLPPGKPLRHYHILNKKQAARRAQGQTARVSLPLARFHEQGTKFMPARKNALVQPEDLRQIERWGVRWVLGQPQPVTE